jgi:hypothetical protein
MSNHAVATLEEIANVSPEDTNDAIAEAMAFVAGILGDRWGSAGRPDDPRNLTAEQILDIIEGFRSWVSGNVSTGDVSINFTDIVLYACGRDLILNENQRFLIISACTVVRMRPLPVLRWVDFVLANLDNPKRIRFVLTACKISKKLLASRIQTVVRRDLSKLELPKIPRVLFIGYTKTGISTLRGMANGSNDALPVFIPEMPLQGRRKLWHTSVMSELSDIPSINPELVSPDKALELCEREQIDVVLTGCKVIGRTKSDTIEIVNSLPIVELTNEAHGYGVPVLVAAGMYKIWPSEFYERHKKLIVESEYIDGELSNGFWSSNDIDWIVTERGCFEYSEFGTQPVIKRLFDYEQLEFLAALGACRNEKLFKYAIEHAEQLKDAIQHADQTLADLSVHMSMGKSSESPMTMQEEYQVHPETPEYWRTRKLPEHVERARDYFVEHLNDEQWYCQYQGKYMAVMCEGDEVLKNAYKRWGYRPLFATLVTREETIRIIRPRGLVNRMKEV